MDICIMFIYLPFYSVSILIKDNLSSAKFIITSIRQYNDLLSVLS